MLKTCLVALACAFAALSLSACGGGAGAQRRPPIIATPPTAAPEYLATTDADAIRIATSIEAKPGNTFASTGAHTIANVSSVEWVRAPISTVNKYFSQINPRPTSGNFPGSTRDTQIWVFEVTGDIREYSKTSPDGLGALTHTLYLMVEPHVPGAYETEGPPIDLSQLGTVHTVPRGVSPGLDALRAPTDNQTPTITVGAPSLVNGKVQVPVSTTGSGLAAYSGFNVHLRWTPGVFSFDSATNTGTVIASPFCPAPAPDADGAGVLYACTALGGASTTQAGLLGTISLTPAASGCSVLHLFTYGGADAGDDSTGTYTIDPATNPPQTLPTIDGSSDVRAQIC